MTADPLQAIVDAIDGLIEKSARTVWVRQLGAGNNIRKDTLDGDNVIVVAVTKALDNTSISPNATDVNININYPVSFTKPPTLIAIPHAKKPLMVSVSNVGVDDATLSVRTVGSVDTAVDVAAISYIAIGPKAQSN